MSRWRLIDSGLCGASYNMAIDEALATEADIPVLRFYGWSRPSVSIGCFQSVDEVDLEYISERRIELVRRITGGRGILHDNELTYSFSAPVTGVFGGGLKRNYLLIAEAFAMAFRLLGLSPDVTDSKRIERRARSPICFETASLGELKLDGRKVIGSAQKRWPGRFMQQGSLPLSVDFTSLARVFRSGRDADAEDSMTGLMDVVPSLSAESLKYALISAFTESFGIEFQESIPTPIETEVAERLNRKYGSPEWNLKRQKLTSSYINQ